MVELKTLNDLVFENVISYGQDSLFWTQKDDEDKKFVFPERIKQEAIKWVKNIGTDEKYLDTEGVIRRGMTNWIKHFFNIKDEDLNGQ